MHANARAISAGLAYFAKRKALAEMLPVRQTRIYRLLGFVALRVRILTVAFLRPSVRLN